MKVAILGASNKQHRYSYKAVKMLAEKGHVPFPVHPVIKDIEGLPVYESLGAIPDVIDTVTVYLSAANSSGLAGDIVASGARRVILNPGAESPALADRLRAENVAVLEACTLVLLSTNQF